MRCRKFHKVGHAKIICKEKRPQQLIEVQIADEEEEYQLFVATYFASISSSKRWLIDSSCTNHRNHHVEFSEIRQISNL